MSATQPGPVPNLSVSFKGILALYLIVPLCWLLYGLDLGWFNGELNRTLPHSPGYFFVLQIIFGTPHIIASTIILFGNPDYRQLYKTRLLLMTLALALVFGLGSVFLPYWVLYGIVAAWTVFHVLKQQYGIARGVCRLSEGQFNSLLAISALTGLLIYLGIFADYRLNPDQLSAFKITLSGLCLALIVITGFCQKDIREPLAAGFLWVNPVMIVSSFWFYSESYYVLAILAPRLIHDLTAYYFYLCHDYNRHHRRPANGLYRIAQRLKIPTLAVLPALSIAFALILQNYADAWLAPLTQIMFDNPVPRAASLGLVGYLALMHYYSESFTWKKDSPYRRYILFSW